MKQVYLFAILSMLLGWVVGDMTRPIEAHKGAEVNATHSRAPVKRVKQFGVGTIEIAANLHDDVADKDLPSEVIDARTKLQIARQRALKAAVRKIFPKDGALGRGGPLLPLDAFRPKQRL